MKAERGGIFDPFFHPADAVVNGGMVPVPELFADLGQGHGGQFPH